MTATTETAVRSAEQLVTRLAAKREALAKRYQDQLEQIDRLKNQRASWRRDRELRDSLSESLETANQLSAATRELGQGRGDLESARRAYLAAIDAELGAGAAPARAQLLMRARAQLVPQIKDAPRRIIIPDFEVDPLADPEELEQRAAELRASEEDLGRQLAGLKAQATELDHLAVLRKQHERAGDVFNRDDDEPHHNTARPASEPGTPPDEGGGAGKPSAPGGVTGYFENFVPIVLSDVINVSTILSLEAAQRSGDPRQLADAAHRAGDEVARRISEVRKRRLEIEARAHQLRA
ncbi:MAG TPA: hypothetical protein VF488_03390, partial [Gemmatimonadaceae bacterium]